MHEAFNVFWPFERIAEHVKAEFNLRWPHLAEACQVRSPPHSGDKVIAITGVAHFGRW